MIVPCISAFLIRLEQTTVCPHHISRDPKPGSFRLIFFHQWSAKLFIPQILVIVELEFFIHMHIILHLQFTETQGCPLPVLFFLLMYDFDIRFTARYGVIIPLKWNGITCLALQIQFCHLIGIAVVKIHSTWMNLAECLTFIHAGNHFSCLPLN